MAATSPQTMSNVTFLGRDEVSSFAIANGIIVCFGRNPPTASSVQSFISNIERGLSRFPSGAGLIVVIHDSSTPDQEARDALKRAFPALSKRLVGMAFVLRAKGFVSAAQRAMITAFMLATGNKSKVLATSDIEDAIKWIYARLPSTAGAAPAGLVAREILAFCDNELGPKAK